MYSQKKSPTIWMNVTTSANWNRPPVGIVRVEQALCEELGKILGNQDFKQCIWHGGEFVEWIPKQKLDPSIEKVVNIIFPSTESFELPKRFLARTLAALSKKSQGEKNQILDNSEINVSFPLKTTSTMRPSAGDILISVGLDWDQSYTTEFFTLAKNRGVKIITCCYDLIPVLFPQYCVGDVAHRFKEYFNLLTWGSSAVLCISEQTRKDYLALCNQLGAPERLTAIVPLGDNVSQGTGKLSQSVEKLLSEKFILFVSTIERRKNHEILYRAYHLLCRAGYKEILPKLVFVGMPGWGIGDLLKDIELDPLTQNLIVQLNHVSDLELRELYKKSLFCVYPSLYEGWGLPVGEALAVGKALLVSNQGSLPEVGADLVKYVDPWNAKAWADAILELLLHPNIIREMEEQVREKYSIRKWSDSAVSVMNLIKQMQAEPPKVISLYPGYDLSTQVGMHYGSKIKGSGRSGFLMYGPHRSLAAGKYAVTIFDIPSMRSSGSITLDFVASSGSVCYWQGGILVKELDNSQEEVLAHFEITVEKLIDDYEIRCITNSGNLMLSKIEIMQMQ